METPTPRRTKEIVDAEYSALKAVTNQMSIRHPEYKTLSKILGQLWQEKCALAEPPAPQTDEQWAMENFPDSKKSAA